MERSLGHVPAAARVRRLLLLALVLFLLATTVPDCTRDTGNAPRRNPQLDDAGPVPLAAR